MNEEILIGIIGALCDDAISKCYCDNSCPFADTKDEYDECEAWRTIISIREGREL